MRTTGHRGLGATLLLASCANSAEPADAAESSTTAASTDTTHSAETGDATEGLDESTTASVDDDGTTAADDGAGTDEGGSDETGTADHPTNPELDTLGPNEWRLLSEGGIEFDGHAAYSGGAYDSVNHQFLVFGGGHWDGWRNDVLAFDIATASWSALDVPDPAEDYSCGNVDEASPGMLLSSMRPASRHTYDQVEFIDHLGRMLVWSGPTYSAIWECPGQTLPADTWLFDPADASWTYGNVAGGPQPSGEAHSGGYDPVGETYYAMRSGELWAFDTADDTWTLVEPNGAPTSSSYTRVVTVDTSRRQLWMRPDVYDIASNTWSASAAVGAPPTGLSEAYDAGNDRIIVHSGAQVFAYDPTADTWEVRDPTNPIDAPSGSGDGAYGRFFYDPVDGVVLYIDVSAHVWAYRY